MLYGLTKNLPAAVISVVETKKFKRNFNNHIFLIIFTCVFVHNPQATKGAGFHPFTFLHRTLVSRGIQLRHFRSCWGPLARYLLVAILLVAHAIKWLKTLGTRRVDRLLFPLVYRLYRIYLYNSHRK